MSGGRFNYIDSQACSEIFGYRDDDVIPNVFEDIEISELIYDVFSLIHEYDWYVSGDTSEYDYLESKQEFKEKWLKNDKERTQRIIDETIKNTKEELYKTFGV